MSNARITVWHDLRGSRRWIITLQDEATVIEREFVRDSEEVATIAAKTLGTALNRPVFKSKSDGSQELIQA